ncbi:unnamed protein product [Strongylus vulgaris]|uniref:Uncharacterized protein n=1 Tax=Strongylus vulgaris TaxID=40348 RepID=A0A3P7IKR8_STRVU|nr:unnamed protein product [Strongylus vulgaris]
MDVSAPVRPPSHSRPTQAYYVPRRLLEGGRGPHPANDGKPSDAFVAADAPPNMTKQRSNTEIDSAAGGGGGGSFFPREKSSARERCIP